MRAVARRSVAAAILVFFLFPIYWALITSAKAPEEVLRDPPLFFPPAPTLAHYARAFDVLVRGAFANSLIVTGVVTVIATGLGAMAGYAFARSRLGGFHASFWILATRMLPPVAMIVPLFLFMKALGMIDEHAAVIAAHLIITLPFAVWMMHGYFLEIPVEIEEAAVIDGCSKWQLFARIALPLAAPGLAVTALFCFIFSWNEFLFALVLTRRQAMTLNVVVSGLRSQGGPVMTATAVVAMLPVFALALMAQRYLVRGMTLGAVR